MPDDDDTLTVLRRLEEKVDGLESRLTPMTPARAAAEARQRMSRGYEAAAAEREAAKADEGADGGDDE